MPEQSRFFVGVGAQKAATSWLWYYLMSHPQVMFSPIKELHFFDSKYSQVHAGAIREKRRVLDNLSAFGRFARRHPVRAMGMFPAYLGMLRHDEAAYRRFLDRARGPERISGEITPAYMVLTEEGVQAMERALSKPLYLLILRNPADRYWSHVRFRSRWTDELARTEDLLELLRQDTYRLRSDYARFLTVLERFVEPGRIFLSFYEDLFDPGKSQAECDRLCDFLSISHHAANPRQRVNLGDRVSTEKFDRLGFIKALEGDYRFFADRFGEALPQSWRQDLALLEAA